MCECFKHTDTRVTGHTILFAHLQSSFFKNAQCLEDLDTRQARHLKGATIGFASLLNVSRNLSTCQLATCTVCTNGLAGQNPMFIKHLHSRKPPCEKTHTHKQYPPPRIPTPSAPKNGALAFVKPQFSKTNVLWPS